MEKLNEILVENVVAEPKYNGTRLILTLADFVQGGTKSGKNE